MVTKPHFRQKRAVDVKFGDKVYSGLIGETFCVTEINHTGPRIDFTEGCFTMRVNRYSLVWVETKPRGFK